MPKLTAENYETLCKKTKNTCIIVFSEGDNRVSELAAKHAKKPITFLMVGPNEQTVFAKQTGVTAYPDTVLVYCKLKKIWRMAGFDLKSIEEAID